MEFRVERFGAAPDVSVIRNAIRALDAAAADIDRDAQVLLRVAAAIDASALLSVLSGVGMSVTSDRIWQLPSVCCGG